MRALLSKTIQRRLHLIECLAHLNTWVAVDQLVQLLDCTDKTLMKDLEIINEEWEEYVQIDFSKRKGLMIRGGQTNKIKNVYQQVLKESTEFQFIERIFFEPTQDADYWIKELYVSETSFYRMIRQLTKALARHGLTLQRKPFCLVAEDERWVRLFYESYFEEAYGGAEWPFETDEQEMFCFLLRTSTDFDVLLDNRQILQHAYLFMVTCIRATQGFLLSEEIYEEPEDIIEQLITISGKYVRQLLANTSYQLVDGWVREVSHGVFYEFYNWANPQQEIRIKLAIDRFLDKLERAVEFPLPSEDRKKIGQRMMHWYLTYTIYPYDRVILRHENKVPAREIRTLYPIFSKLVTVNLQEIEKECNFPWVETREADILCTLVAEWQDLPLRLEALRQQVNLLVVSDRGAKHGKMLKDLIKSQLFDKVSVDVYLGLVLFTHKEDLEQFHKYDIVLANNPIENYQDENLLLIDNFISQADWGRLNSMIIRIQRRRSREYLKQVDEKSLLSGKEVYPQASKRISNFLFEEEADSFYEL
ncbi:helix-turn-helix domain-containing protein [Enterococcus sp. 2201sp1_2201st1_B8_2201SCRN_220225]|uniref:helix-turn-helix domain-containing protein n=1 Tax=unclassified Enterococcus TaxID=2608891 RepID=UPI0034A39E92